jgi:hypothetical protein
VFYLYYNITHAYGLDQIYFWSMCQSVEEQLCYQSHLNPKVEVNGYTGSFQWREARQTTVFWRYVLENNEGIVTVISRHDCSRMYDGKSECIPELR